MSTKNSKFEILSLEHFVDLALFLYVADEKSDTYRIRVVLCVTSFLPLCLEAGKNSYQKYHHDMSKTYLLA